MKKFNVTYEIDYVHCVTVGVEAQDAHTAINKAEQAFDQGDIWDDTDMPLLYDDFNEKDGESLNFTAQEVSDFPEPDESVKELKRRQVAFEACQALLAGDIEKAMTLAGRVMGHDDLDKNTSNCYPKIAIAIQGGFVQSVVSDQPSLLPNDVLVIDYDINGTNKVDHWLVPQDSGDDARAIVYSRAPELPKIGLDAIFERFQLIRGL